MLIKPTTQVLFDTRSKGVRAESPHSLEPEYHEFTSRSFGSQSVRHPRNFFVSAVLNG